MCIRDRSTGAAGGMSLRGIGGSPTAGLLVLIDGHPQYMGLMGHPIADAYQSMLAERVEVLRGPASDVYKRQVQVSVLMTICLLIPVQMASQTWDDHDRSARFTCRDFGANYLMTLPDEGNRIIFCYGDNDTFPLWYNQDTEEVRRDAGVCNLSYAQTD